MVHTTDNTKLFDPEYGRCTEGTYTMDLENKLD
jgi:hypothetical protein